MTRLSTMRGVARCATTRSAAPALTQLGRRGFASFPSLTITKDKVTAQGSFAEQQKEFLDPCMQTATDLGKMLKEKNIGVVAHFYMDAELQGTLVKVSEQWEHVFCADSLAMGFAAVDMAKQGVKAIACLGVDFMAESVKACLDQNGFKDVPVFRLKEEHIGCSLAASAEQSSYDAYLKAGAKLHNPLHVVYINTALQTKARTHNIVPTITCTSSNVVRTILQATAEMPDCNILYGPDTYMGENLKQLFETLVQQTDADVQKLHPQHTIKSIERLLTQFHYYKQGICVVHHMFGGEVTEQVQREYPLDENTFYTAHFEVPGEMFKISSEAATKGKGVVGSTSNILNFITEKAAQPIASNQLPKKFILGTEAGMITGIVKNVQDTLKQHADPNAAIEIVFPVAAEAVAQTGDDQMPVVPGVKGGEGCSTAGGCATCPFMKMNDLDSLVDLVEELPMDSQTQKFDELLDPKLEGFMARIPEGGVTKDGYDLLDGTLPIAYMSAMMKNGTMAPELTTRVLSIKGEATQATQQQGWDGGQKMSA